MVDAQSTSAIEGATAELVGFVDKHKNLLGRYYDRIRLIPFTPDPYTVYLAEPTELVRTQGLKVFDRMMLDEMVNSSVAGYISQVLTDARNQPAGDSAECKAVCDFVTAALDRIEGGLMPSLYELLYGAIYGFGVSPAPYQIIMDGPWLGYVGYKSIRALEPHFLEPVHEFEHGRVIGWNQIDRYSSGPVFFRQDEVVHYVINARYDAARGRSMLLPAHPFWVAKTLLLQMRNMVAEWTIGKLVISHDRSAKDSIDPAKFQSFVAELVSNFLLRAGFGLPAGVKAELLSGASTVTPAVFDSALKHCDQGILRTCGGNWMLSEEPDAGSRALAETQQGGASARFKVPREHFRGIIQHQLVNRLCKINGFRPEHWPKFTLAPAIEGDRQAMVTAAISAISAGALGGEQPGDANWFRERLGMPLIKEGAAQQQAKPAAPAEQPDSGMGEPPESVEVRKTSTYTDGWVWVHDADDAEDFGWQEQPRIPAGGPGGGQFGGHGWVRATSLSSKKGHWIRPGEEGAHMRPIHEQPKYEKPKEEKPKPFEIDAKQHPALAEALGWRGHGEDSGHGHVFEPEITVGKSRKYSGRESTSFSISGKDKQGRDTRFGLHVEEAGDKNNPRSLYRVSTRSWGPSSDTVSRYGTKQEAVNEARRILSGISRVSKNQGFVVKHSSSETFASADRWWERDLSGAEQRVDFAEIDRGLQGIIDDSREGLNVEWKRSLDALRLQVEGWVSNDRVSAGAMLRKAGDVKMILDGFVAKTVDAGMLAYGFGERQGARELVASGLPNPKRARTVQRFADADPVGPDNPFSLDAYKKLLEAKSFRIASKMGAQVVSRVQLLLENCYENGVSIEETRKRLASLFDDLAAGHMISPGRADGYDYTSEPIQETTVRTIANTAFNGARQDLYQRNSDWVKGYEISEVGGGHDGQRSHPLSEHLHGLKVAYLLKDGSVNPYAKQFAGAQAYNDRKVDVALTVMDEPIKWSTQAELAKALRWKEKLSPDFV